MQHRPTRRVAARRAPQLHRALRLAALALPLAAAVAAAPSVHAQAQAQAARHYDIPAGPLAAALGRLGTEAGVLLAFSAEQTSGRHSPGARGELSVPQALAAVLAGTGLEAIPEGAGWRLQPAPQRRGEAGGEGVATLATVQVRADAAAERTSPLALRRRVAAGALGSRAQLDTPFSTTVVTSEQLEERQVSSMTDVFALDPSVTNEAGHFTMFASQISSRGLTLDAGTSYKLNGMPVYAQSLDIPFDHLDSVQLLKGATGFMNGFGAPGGIVNFVTRQPGEEAVRSVDAGYRSGSVRSVHADLGSRFNAEDRFGWRVNATHEEGGNFNPGGRIKRDSLSVGLAANLTSSLTARLDLLYSERLANGEPNAPLMSSYVDPVLPAAISAKDNYLATGGTYHDSRLGLVTVGLEYRISEAWKLAGKYGHSDVTAKYMRDFNSLLNRAGDYSASLLGGGTKLVYDSAEVVLNGHFRTGHVAHQLVVGVEQSALKVDGGNNGYPWTSNGQGNLHVPFPNVYTGGKLDLRGWYRANEYDKTSLFVSDTLTLGRWSLIAGVRHNDYDQKNFSKATGAVSSSYRKNGTLTPTVALLYKSSEQTTLYGSYVESLESGGVVGANYANANDILKPLKSKQYEAGIKTEAGAWNATAALFRVERAAAYANAANYWVQEGLTVLQGAELNASVKPLRAWTLGGGVMLLDAKYRRGTAYDGDRVAGTPRASATAYARYEPPQVPGLAVHANLKHVGDSYVRPGRPLPTSSRTVVGVGASYVSRIGTFPVTLRAEIGNLFDRKGWVSHGNQISLLDPRTFALNAKVDF